MHVRDFFKAPPSLAAILDAPVRSVLAPPVASVQPVGSSVVHSHSPRRAAAFSLCQGSVELSCHHEGLLDATVHYTDTQVVQTG